MKRVNIFILFVSFSLLFTSCASIHNPFSRRSSIEIKEGYLSLKTINMNLAKQMPISEKIGSNEITIVSATVFAGSNHKTLIVELEFIFKSFEIPEGLPAIARANATLKYEPTTREFKLDNVSNIEIRYLKDSLLEYVTPQQKKFIPETLRRKLYELVLHKSKKQLTPIKSFSINEGKVKVVFRGFK